MPELPPSSSRDLASARAIVPVQRPTPGTQTDADLLRRIRAGHGESWEIVINRYERLVYSVALRNGLTATDAMDVTQSTFMVLLESHTKLRSDQSLASWLMTVARRQSWKVRERSRQEVPTTGLVPPEHEPGIDWEQAVSVHTALSQLGSPCRELLTALYFDPSEPTYTAIARRLGRSIGSIGPLRGRCLAKLRALLEDD